jgi:spermidine/putrescine transport system ATP-binding protein
MTMADTVAVMNHGLIEQMGRPGDLYDNPATTFVANFLGQSNLVPGTVAGSDRDMIEVSVEGGTVRASRSRAHVDTGAVWVGARPEKVFLHDMEHEAEAGSNVLRGGRISDVSFSGVSTQYLVRMPWGQELNVFEQNTGARDLFAVGAGVDLSWRPEHTFLLDAAQDASAGVEDKDRDG